jgi:hypothetical protein
MPVTVKQQLAELQNQIPAIEKAAFVAGYAAALREWTSGCVGLQKAHDAYAKHEKARS